MKTSQLKVVVLFVAATVVTGVAYQSSPANRPWPVRGSEGAGRVAVLSPTEAMKSFWMPPGYHVELVASEPLVQDPIAMDWDPGRAHVVAEYPEYVKDLEAPEPNLEQEEGFLPVPLG